MPLIRKVMDSGTSKVVAIPPSWLRCIEKQTGQEVKEILMEVDGVIIIKPVIEKKPEGP